MKISQKCIEFYQKKIENQMQSPWMGFFSALALTGFGYAISEDKMPAWIKIGSLSLCLITFLPSQYAINKDRKRTDDNLFQQANRLENLIKTMPPEAFLSEFAEIFQKCRNFYKEIQENDKKTAQEVELIIRMILGSILALVKLFDKSSKETRYAANIMLFEGDLGKKSEERIKFLGENIKFITKDIDIKKLHGVLILETDLSVNSENHGEYSPDSDLPQSIILPVPQERKDMLSALPGAPKAFLTHLPNQFLDVNDLHSWMKEEKNGDFLQSTVAEVKEYFTSEAAKNIKSFISVPLPSKNGVSDRDHTPIAVLNIHKNEINLFGEQKQLNNFTCVMEPFFDMIKELIEIRKSVKMQSEELLTLKR